MKDDGKTKERDAARRYGNERPISLYPLKPEETLRRAMSIPPLPKGKPRPETKKDGE